MKHLLALAFFLSVFGQTFIDDRRYPSPECEKWYLEMRDYGYPHSCWDVMLTSWNCEYYLDCQEIYEVAW